MKKNILVKLFLSLFIAVGIIIIGVFISFKIKENKIIQNYQKTTGTYINRKTYALIYKYSVNNKVYTVTTEYGTSNIPPIGSQKTIYYNPNNPQEAIIKGGGQSNFFLILIGMMFILIPILILSLLFLNNENLTMIILGSTFFLIGAGLYYFVANDASSLSPLIVFKTNFIATLMSFVFMIMGICEAFQKFFPEPKKDKNGKTLSERIMDKMENIPLLLQNKFFQSLKLISIFIMSFIVSLLFSYFIFKSDLASKFVLIPCLIFFLYLALYSALNLVYLITNQQFPNILNKLFKIFYLLPFCGLILLFIYVMIINQIYIMLIVIAPVAILITYKIIKK